jgi:hypothetical protein
MGNLPIPQMAPPTRGHFRIPVDSPVWCGYTRPTLAL